VPVECGDTRSSETPAPRRTGEERVVHAREPKHIERIHRSPISQERRPMPVRRRTLPPPSPAAHHIARSLPFHLSALIGDVSRRAASSPFAPPISRSLPVSDRVPLFRVLYYFFYQSARFQDALRPAESCAINHEM